MHGRRKSKKKTKTINIQAANRQRAWQRQRKCCGPVVQQFVPMFTQGLRKAICVRGGWRDPWRINRKNNTKSGKSTLHERPLVAFAACQTDRKRSSRLIGMPRTTSYRRVSDRSVWVSSQSQVLHAPSIPPDGQPVYPTIRHWKAFRRHPSTSSWPIFSMFLVFCKFVV